MKNNKIILDYLIFHLKQFHHELLRYIFALPIRFLFQFFLIFFLFAQIIFTLGTFKISKQISMPSFDCGRIFQPNPCIYAPLIRSFVSPPVRKRIWLARRGQRFPWIVCIFSGQNLLKLGYTNWKMNTVFVLSKFIIKFAIFFSIFHFYIFFSLFFSFASAADKCIPSPIK